MTDSLDMLPEEVAGAIKRMLCPLDPSVLSGATAQCDALNMITIRDYCMRVARENAELRSINGQMEVAERRAERAEAELAKLRERIAKACRADGQRVFDLLCLPVEFDGTLALVKLEDGE